MPRAEAATRRSSCSARPRARRPTGRRSPSASGLPVSSAPLSRPLVAFLLSRAVSRPVARVSEASRALAAGERPDPLPVAGPREVATLASSFNHLSGELDKAQDAERTFLLSVSHELKTPLTAIRGHAEALEDGVLEPEAAGLVIEREARRLERLVGDLLDLARLRRRSFSVRAEPLDLAELSVLAVQRHEVAARSFRVGLQTLSEPDARAVGDPDRVLQALSNLVENALRSTPAGGTVRILAGPGRLEVVDDGPGLAEADLPRAFERFYLYDRAQDGAPGRDGPRARHRPRARAGDGRRGARSLDAGCRLDVLARPARARGGGDARPRRRGVAPAPLTGHCASAA